MENLSNMRVSDYKSLLGQFSTGVTVITSLHGEEPVGFTCQSFSALSVNPPLVLICPDKRSTTWPRIREVGSFAVSMLASDQQHLSARFAKSGTDKFSSVAWSPSPMGLPTIDGALAWIECDVTQELDAGDHTVVMGTIREHGVGPEKEPLLFHRGKYINHRTEEATV